MTCATGREKEDSRNWQGETRIAHLARRKNNRALGKEKEDEWKCLSIRDKLREIKIRLKMNDSKRQGKARREKQERSQDQRFIKAGEEKELTREKF